MRSGAPTESDMAGSFGLRLGRRYARGVRLLVILGALLLAWSVRDGHSARADGPSGDSDLSSLVPREILVLPPAGRAGRTLLNNDPLAAEFVGGTWKTPAAGDKVGAEGGPTRTWETLHAGDDGSFTSPAFQGGYAYIPLKSEAPRVVLLEAAGHGMVYVNGLPRVGDPYGHGYVHVPIALRPGTNELVFQVVRGGPLRVKLASPRSEATFVTSDVTLPDVVLGQPTRALGAVIVSNNSETARAGLVIRTKVGEVVSTTSVPSLPPLSIRKVPFTIEGPAPSTEGKYEVEVELRTGEPDSAKELDRAALSLAAVRPEATQKKTFRSDIDGSVQYFGLVPASVGSGEVGSPGGKPGLILTLHGAGVEGIGQARVYGPKPWAHIVAPTNRRTFGFDWEDWGRLDALEVLDLAIKELDADREHVYLTGHSMGGHGTWHLGTTYPDRFAAIAPSAGWVSMWSYAGARRSQTSEASPVRALVERAAMPSDTLALSSNLGATGVYVLHGDKDDNVPVDQARMMRKRLAEFHPDFSYFEQPGAGHWWDGCCDWPPLMSFLNRHELPHAQDVRHVDFVTSNPGVSGRAHWVVIETQIKALLPSSVRLDWDPQRRRISGTTENVARLQLQTASLKAEGPIEAELDGKAVSVPPNGGDAAALWLEHGDAGVWAVAAKPSVLQKGPHRAGPFKEAFRNRFQLVYGTRGTAEENAWALAKARYDAEVFWYRGNGSVDVIPDTNFDADADKDRAVILYGNADTNACWAELLKDSPVQVRRGVVDVGGREMKADDLACLFLRPRPGSERACVAVIGGTGPKGMRLTDRLPYFVSGVALPDCTVLGPDSLTGRPAGIRAAGFFGNDWSVATGEFAWSE